MLFSQSIATFFSPFCTHSEYLKGKEGTTLKSIYVYTNTIPRKNVVRVKAFVVPAKNE